SAARIKPTKCLLVFLYFIIRLKSFGISVKLLFISVQSLIFLTVHVRQSLRTVGFCLITSATTFCDRIPCFIALLQLHIGHNRDLQHHTRYNVFSPVSTHTLYSSTSAQSNTRSAFLNSIICKSSK